MLPGARKEPQIESKPGAQQHLLILSLLGVSETTEHPRHLCASEGVHSTSVSASVSPQDSEEPCAALQLAMLWYPAVGNPSVRLSVVKLLRLESRFMAQLRDATGKENGMRLQAPRRWHSCSADRAALS